MITSSLAQSPSISRRPETAASATPLPLSTNESVFHMPPLVWDQIKKYIKPAEQEEVASLIGRKFIEDNEIINEEIKSLLDIWKDFRVQNDEAIRAVTPSKTKRSLPEPPGRELLEQKITLLLKDLTKKSYDRGTDLQKTIVQTPREKEILQYFTKEDMPTRPKSASSLDQRSSTNRPVDTRSPSSARSVMTSLPLERLKPFLNVYDIQQVVYQIREAIKEEHNLLLEDVEFLQKTLENEWIFKNKYNDHYKTLTIPREIASASKKAQVSQPSLQDLKEFNSKLEKAYISSESSPKAPLSPSTRPNTTLNKMPRQIPKLRLSSSENLVPIASVSTETS